MKSNYDFSGWATKNDLRCSDGRTIRRDAFKDCDGMIVPLVWNHQHNEPGNVLGHALLENREQGVYTYGWFNDTEKGGEARELVKHGDVISLSIYANQLKQNGGNVMHGVIREVSLVLAGANPGAFIDAVLVHGEYTEEEAVISAMQKIELCHAEAKEETPMAKPEKANLAAEDEDSGETVQDVFNTLNEKQKKVVYALIGKAVEDAKGGAVQHSADAEEDDDDGETVQDVFDTLSEKQKKVVYALIGKAVEDAKSNGGNDNMKHNVFDNDMETGDVLTHSEMEDIFSDAKRYGSLKDSFLAHGIENIEYLFPDAKNVTDTPEWIKRPDEWVSVVMNGVSHSPFSRIKSLFADITEDEARALGYLPDRTHRDSKGNLVDAEGHPAYKKEEVFTLLKRTTTPTTIYKKQKIDRDDIIDITDFVVVSWIKTEMRGMLNEEIARAILIGDGRPASSDDKINELNIRPIAKDSGFFTIQTKIRLNSSIDAAAAPTYYARAFIHAAVKSRKRYRGSGSPTLFTTEDMLIEMLLLEDALGHRMYKNETELAAALRVSKIVTVPVLENNADKLLGIIVNLSDYRVGADKGGEVNMFDDFDIDYNAQKYLIETRCSGALVKPRSAIAISMGDALSGESNDSTIEIGYSTEIDGVADFNI